MMRGMNWRKFSPGPIKTILTALEGGAGHFAAHENAGADAAEDLRRLNIGNPTAPE